MVIKRRLTLIYLICSACLFVGALPAAAAKFCPADLKLEVEKIANSSALRSARLGVFVQTRSQVVLNLDGEKLFVPASTLKLLTTAAALRLLGADYQIRTSLMAALPVDGAIANLWLIGRSDPSFNLNSLQALVGKLKASGVRQLRGRIMVPHLSGVSSGLGAWLWSDLQEDYAAIADALILNENVLDWTITPTKINEPVQFAWDHPALVSGWTVENLAVTGAVGATNSLDVKRSLSQKQLIISGTLPINTEPELGATAIPDPEAHFLRLLQVEMRNQGIQILPSSTNQTLEKPPTLEIAAIASPKLAELLITTNKTSNNLYAEALLRNLGSTDATSEITRDLAGIATVSKFWQNQGINSFILKDGSGLSPLNLITPQAITQVLVIMAQYPLFRSSLAVAGVDGTLRHRFKNTIAQNRMQAKTGTLEGVVALAGYAQPPKYEELMFSIIINNSHLPKPELRQQVEAIALLMMKMDCDQSLLKNPQQ